MVYRQVIAIRLRNREVKMVSTSRSTADSSQSTTPHESPLWTCTSSRRALNVMSHSACMPVLQKDAASSQRCWLPVQKLQPSGPSNGSLGISAQYSLAEHYLGAFTPVAERLLLGSTQGLEQAHLLADHRISHAIILCCGPEVSRLTTIPAFLSLASILRSVTWAYSPYGRAPAVGIHPRAWSRCTCWQIKGSPLPSFSAVV